MTAQAARKHVERWLAVRGLHAEKIRARTVSFEDLGRGEMVFVDVWAQLDLDKWGDLIAFAKQNGFRVRPH